MNDEQWALENARNRNQNYGQFKTVLCLCSAGLLRSPTAAFVLSQPPFSYNTRSAGMEKYALIPLSAPLIEWADEIVVMGGEEHLDMLYTHPYFFAKPKPVKVLNMPNKYQYRDPELIEMIVKRYNDCKIMEKAHGTNN